jgi:hypothetical protein
MDNGYTLDGFRSADVLAKLANARGEGKTNHHDTALFMRRDFSRQTNIVSAAVTGRRRTIRLLRRSYRCSTVSARFLFTTRFVITCLHINSTDAH